MQTGEANCAGRSISGEILFDEAEGIRRSQKESKMDKFSIQISELLNEEGIKPAWLTTQIIMNQR
jgi:hypothetical protein